MSSAAPPPVLAVSDLTVVFETDRGALRATDGVSLDLQQGRTLCLVGESGCGKSVTALAIMRLLPRSAEVLGGRVELHGRDLLALTERELRGVRGREISMIFQEPLSALNPVITVGAQVSEVIRAHQGLSRKAARRKAVEVLEMVGLPAAAERYHAHPHELSGGMRQRIMIAAALACGPAILIADEPTTALDVTIQAQILDLLCRLQQDLGMATLLITHDLGIVAETADDVVVMYAGQVVERAPSESLFASPCHPYTQALLRSLPRPDRGGDGRLWAIPGSVPELTTIPQGCRFADRCEHVFAPCRREDPELRKCAEGRFARCHLVEA